MIGNKSNIYIADKASNLAGMFVSAYLLGQKSAPRENPPLMHLGAIKMGRNISNILNLSLSGPIYTKFGTLTYNHKPKLFCKEYFFSYWS